MKEIHFCKPADFLLEVCFATRRIPEKSLQFGQNRTLSTPLQTMSESANLVTTDTKMRFRQLDRIVEIVPGESLVATKQVLGNEDYLRDHFPLFKVMPGVLMLEALFQASCWLIRSTENFRHSVLILKEARNVKFADFMEPGQTLDVNVSVVKWEDNLVTIKASGTKGDVVGCSARLIVELSNLKESDPDLEALDEYMRESMRKELRLLQSDES
jgi:3-hydroxyacyl-[acyl-carrier-protein] dehydratase